MNEIPSKFPQSLWFYYRATNIARACVITFLAVEHFFYLSKDLYAKLSVFVDLNDIWSVYLNFTVISPPSQFKKLWLQNFPRTWKIILVYYHFCCLHLCSSYTHGKWNTGLFNITLKHSTPTEFKKRDTRDDFLW